MRFLKMLAVITVGILGFTTSASATTLSWLASAAQTDSYGQFAGGNAFWFVPGAPGTGYVFSGYGNFTENDSDNNGKFETAKLTGIIVNPENNTDQWSVNVSFKAIPDIQVHFPNKELKPSAYVENGGPVDTNTFRFYNFDFPNTKLTGLGSNVGKSITLSQRPEDLTKPFQVGVGANGKNINMGGSGWYNYAKYSGKYFASNGYGDINIDLTPVVPEPASMMLLGSGLMASILRRRNQKV